MEPILIELGFIKIYWYSVMIFLGIIAALFIIFKEARKHNIKEDFLVNLTFYAIIFGIVGARIYYVLFNLDYYGSNMLEIFKIYNGGLAIHGGIIAGIIWIIYYCKKNKVEALKMLDIMAPAILLGQAIGRWGNFFNQEAHGIETTREVLEQMLLPKFIINGMEINQIYYYPTFYFESLWNLFGFMFILILSKKKKLRIGQITGIYFVWYSIARFFIESLRTDSLMLGPIRIAQLISILLIILGLYLIFKKPSQTRIKKYEERRIKNENRL